MFLAFRVIVLPLAVLLVGACSNNADHHYVIPLFRSIPFPTGLDYWPERRILFASSYYDGSVQAVSLVNRQPFLFLKNKVIPSLSGPDLHWSGDETMSCVWSWCGL